MSDKSSERFITLPFITQVYSNVSVDKASPIRPCWDRLSSFGVKPVDFLINLYLTSSDRQRWQHSSIKSFIHTASNIWKSVSLIQFILGRAQCWYISLQDSKDDLFQVHMIYFCNSAFTFLHLLEIYFSPGTFVVLFFIAHQMKMCSCALNLNKSLTAFMHKSSTLGV